MATKIVTVSKGQTVTVNAPGGDCVVVEVLEGTFKVTLASLWARAVQGAPAVRVDQARGGSVCTVDWTSGDQSTFFGLEGGAVVPARTAYTRAAVSAATRLVELAEQARR